MTEQKSTDWLLLNAVECWLYYFPKHQWVPQYLELRDVLQEAINNKPPVEVEEPKEEQIQKPQGRKPSPKTTTKNV